MGKADKERVEEFVIRDDEDRILARYRTKGGKIDGEYLSFFTNGQPMVRLHFRDGLKEGEATSFYHDGRIKEHGFFHDDKLIGEYVSYYENGQVREKEQYDDEGKLHGTYHLFTAMAS